MISTTILFGCLVSFALAFLLLGILRVAEEYYMDIALIFASGVIFILLGYQCYILEPLLQFAFLGLFLVVLGTISLIFGVVRVFYVTIEEFGYWDKEWDRDPDYEYA